MSLQNGCRVLIVEDDAMVAELMRRRLEAAGYAVRIAGEAAEAFRTVESWRPVVCLIDKGLPGTDGTELARRIALESVHAETRVVLISGSFLPRDQETRGPTGVSAVLAKPFTAERLLGLVERLAREPVVGDEVFS